MAQYKTGTVTVTNGSAIIAGNSTTWLLEISVGDYFILQGKRTAYTVGSVDSDTQITLTSNITEVSGTYNYSITRDFTDTYNFPIVNYGDVNAPTLISKAIVEIDGALSAESSTGAAIESKNWAITPEDVLVPEGNLVDEYSALHYSLKTAADLALTNADVITTNNNVQITNADVITTNNNVQITNADVITTNNDAASTAQDAIDTAADLALTNADVITTNNDVISSNANATEAFNWAQTPENILVPEGNLVDEYSAYHWSLKAQAYAVGQLVYQGGWDASTGAYPANAAIGDYYKITVAGTISGTVYNVGDSIICNDATNQTWDKIDNTDLVTSVAGKVGTVTLVPTDVGAVDKTGDTMTGKLAFNNIISSDGTLHLYNGATSSGYAIGIETGTLYYRGNLRHRWYINKLADNGSSDYMELDANGLTVGNGSSTNKITLANPGIGNTSTIKFAKTSDAAEIRVTEWTNDSTEFQFYMSDNPSTSADKFNWHMNSWRGRGADWRPLEFSGYDVTLQGSSLTINGNLNVGNNPYISTNGVLNQINESKTGTLSLTSDVSGFTESSNKQFYIVLTTDGTTFSAYDRNGGTAYVTDVAITGTAQTIAFGVTVTFSGTTGGVAGDWWIYGVWNAGTLASTKNVTVTEPTPTAANHLTRKDYVDTQIALTPNPNIIINGNFDIWQRGASFSAVVSATTTADRFRYYKSGAMVHSVARSVLSPTFAESGINSTYSLLVDTATADAVVDANDYTAMIYRVEGYDFAPLNGGNATLSFWVRSSVVGTYCVSFRNAANDRSYIAEYTINAIDTWEKKTITVPLNEPTGVWEDGNLVGLDISFTLSNGTTFQTTANTWQTGNFLGSANQVNFNATLGNQFRISQVKLEQGSTATPFVPKKIREELADCQRYYQKSYNLTLAPGTASGAGAVLLRYTFNDSLYTYDFYARFPVVMRTNPTVVWYSTEDGAINSIYNATTASNIAVTSTAFAGETTSGYPILASNVASGSAIRAHYTADAEL